MAAGRKRSSVLKFSNSSSFNRTSKVSICLLCCPSRYALAGCSIVVSLLLGVWALTVLHRVHTKVGHAANMPDWQQDDFAASSAAATHVQIAADATSGMSNKRTGNATPAASQTDSALGVAAAVAAAAGALAADSSRDPQPDSQDHQQQQHTQQVQVQVTVTHLEPHKHTGHPGAAANPLTSDIMSHGPPSELLHTSQLQGGRLRQQRPPGLTTANSQGTGKTAQQETPQGLLGGQHKPQRAAGSTRPGPPPKVALLFLVQKQLSHEAVWRAFFQAAAQLQLQPNVAAAAATAAQQTGRVTVADAIGDRVPLHPDVGTYPAWAYPGFRVQHGITPGAEPPRATAIPSTASITQQQASTSQRQSTAAGGSHKEGGTLAGLSSSSGDVTFPAAAAAWEVGVLDAVASAFLHPTAAAAAVQPDSSPADARGQQQGLGGSPGPQQPWSVYKQLSTLREALAVMAPGISPNLAAPGGGRDESKQQHTDPGGQQLEQQAAERPVHVDWQRCLASLRSVSHLGNQGSTSTHQQEQPQQQQQPQAALFSVYVHTPAGVLLPPDSVLSGCELAVRLNTTRGYAQHVLAEAEALLLHAALSDPLNDKFVLVSDASIPLYPPQVIWSQLVFETRSRLDACITPGRDTQLSSRWRSVMATKQFGPQHWRKSSQWFTLSRAHAQLAVADVHVREMLHRYCYTNLTRVYPICVSDEHWLPSLLASYGLDAQTDCEGATHYADWSAGGWHPKTFTAADLTPQLVHLMRTGVSSKTAHLAALQQGPQNTIASTARRSASSPTLQHRHALQAPHESAPPGVAGQLPLGQNEFHIGRPLEAATPVSAARAVLQAEAQPHALHPPLTQPRSAGLAVPASTTSAAAAALQARAHVAAMQMTAADAECNSAQAILTATNLFTRPLQVRQGEASVASSGPRQLLQEQLQQLGADKVGELHGSQLPAAGRDSPGDKRSMLGSSESTQGTSSNHWLSSAGFQPLAQRCPLFARKFPASVQREALYLSLSCEGVGMGSWCAASRWQPKPVVHGNQA